MWKAGLAGLLISLPACSLASAVQQFTGPNAVLERAIEADDARAVDAAIVAGAEVNARGEHAVTPLEYAIGTRRKNAAQALVRHRANPNLKDVEGDSAVSLAVSAFKTDSDLLKLVLAAGGDPNITRPGGDPVITRFLDDANLDAIRYLAAHGASLDADVAQRPMVVGYAISEDWDVVLTLIELGAKLDNLRVREGMVFASRRPTIRCPIVRSSPPRSRYGDT